MDDSIKDSLPKDQKDLVNKILRDGENNSREYFESLSKGEREYALQILRELAKDGRSKKLNEIYELDYDQYPVDIETFVYDDYYMGRILGDQLYPRWLEHMKEYLDPTNNYIEVCLTGDTKIPLLNGTEKTMKELWEEDPDEFFVFSYDFEKDKYVVGQAHSVKKTRKEKVYKVTLDNGKVVKGTGDHNLIRSNGDEVEISNLTPGDYLFTARKQSLKDPKVVSVEECGEEWVYNFTVEDYHNYQLSAGILSRNCITGAIGSGKTTIGLVSKLYHIMRVLCLRNPQDHYNLMETDEIVFGIFNATLELADNVGFQKVSNMIKGTPFFKEKLIHNPRSPEQINFPKNIAIEVGSNFSHALGKHILGASVDEANFQEDAIDDHKSSQIMKTYNAIYRRLESRFLQKGGKIPGQLFLISSKNEQSSFLEVHIEENKDNKTTYVIDEPIWNFKKHLGLYSGKTFRVMVGDQKRDSRVLKKGENAPDGYKVIDVPVEYRESFKRDTDQSLKDIAGEATFSDMNLIKNRQRVRDCVVEEIRDIGKWESPFTKDLVVLDFDDDETEISDYIDQKRFEEYLEKVGYNRPRSIHIDIGVTGDALGVAMTHIAGKQEVTEVDLEGSSRKTEREVYRIDFMIRMTNLEGKELPLIKVLSFIKWLRSLGLNIRVVSTDGYQSTMLRQLLRKQGFQTKLVSVDKTDDAYLYLKDTHMDRRIQMYEYSVYMVELFDLIHNTKKGKVDHPKKNSDGSRGSKDVADSVCASIYNLVNDEVQIKDSSNRPIDYSAFIAEGDDELDPEQQAYNYAISDYKKGSDEEDEERSSKDSDFIVF